LQEANITKLTENISTVRISDPVVLLGSSLLLIYLKVESVHTERRWLLPFCFSKESRLNYS